MSNHDTLQLTTEPGEPTATFTMLLAPRAPDERCDAAVIASDQREKALAIEQTRVLPRGSSTVVAVTGTADRAALRAAGSTKADRVVLKACGREYRIGDLTRRRIREFARVVARNAKDAEPTPEPEPTPGQS